MSSVSTHWYTITAAAKRLLPTLSFHATSPLSEARRGFKGNLILPTIKSCRSSNVKLVDLSKCIIGEETKVSNIIYAIRKCSTVTSIDRTGCSDHVIIPSLSSFIREAFHRRLRRTGDTPLTGRPCYPTLPSCLLYSEFMHHVNGSRVRLPLSNLLNIIQEEINLQIIMHPFYIPNDEALDTVIHNCPYDTDLILTIEWGCPEEDSRGTRKFYVTVCNPEGQPWVIMTVHSGGRDMVTEST